MKPPAFDYLLPDSLQEALSILAEHGEDAKVIAGGQSLIPLLNLRMARPSVLVDINRLADLGGISRTQGQLYIGALARQAWLERSPVVAAGWPLLPAAISWVAHPQIRTRGTVGGSAVHADAAAELPAVLTTLDAEFVVQSTSGERRVPAAEFFLGQYETALQPHELLTEIVVPPMAERTGTGFSEYARRHGDFALAGAAAVVQLDETGRCTRARLTLLGVGQTPARLHEVEDELTGTYRHQGAEAALPKQVLETSVRALAIGEDFHADRAHREEVAAHVAIQALTYAFDDAGRRLP
ncbi:FAD binding domain-containing protein [Pseudactinotalea sp.]|uniref:FAD binding domain-containing protein n=1 Tax=Pseudactinotalea sp. TaxID=1926260 RepID=UPI003B3BCA4B